MAGLLPCVICRCQHLFVFDGFRPIASCEGITEDAMHIAQGILDLRRTVRLPCLRPNMGGRWLSPESKVSYEESCDRSKTDAPLGLDTSSVAHLLSDWSWSD